jgi:hypothetical protein
MKNNKKVLLGLIACAVVAVGFVTLGGPYIDPPGGVQTFISLLR